MAEPITPKQLHESHRWFHLDELASLPGNPNQGDTASLESSVDEFGWMDGIVVHSGVIIAGNHRLEQAQQRGEDGLPGYDLTKIIPDLDDARRMTMAIVHNRTTRQGTDNPELLADALVGIAETDLGLAHTAGIHDLSPAVAPLIDLTNYQRRSNTPGNPNADVPPLPESPITNEGDIWTLGPHRLICGDSTDADVVSKLLESSELAALVTDPPYGVDYGETVDFLRSLGKSTRPEEDSHVANDGTFDAIALWNAAFPLWAKKMASKSAFYCWSPPGAQQVDLGIALANAGFAIRGSVIWQKSSFSFSRSDHKYQHEPAWYGWLESGTHLWFGPNNESSVWEYPRPQSSELHPTMKPVALIERCVRNISPQGGLVGDPFAGSGTLMVACHLANRRAAMVEQSERYCDVIARRYHDLTGDSPKLNGRPRKLK